MKHYNYWIKKELTKYDAQEKPILICRDEEFHDKEAEKVFSEMPEGYTYQPATRNGHFTALNCLPVVVGTRWAVSEDVYFEFLEMLPPIDRKDGGFYILEACTSDGDGGNIRSAYYKQGEQYWHAYESTRF